MNVPLLRQVQEQILREPERFRMLHWVSQESCGTTCCIAGWAMALGLPEVTENAVFKAMFWRVGMDNYDDPMGFSPVEARRTLGISPVAASRLFHSAAWPEPFQSAWRNHEDDPKARAEVASARIDFFIATQGTDVEPEIQPVAAEVESVELVAVDA